MIAPTAFLDPSPVCGVNAAEALLYGATVAVAGSLPFTQKELPAKLAALLLQPGDILIWRDPAGGQLYHSTTLDKRSPEGWVLDEKWGTLPAVHSLLNNVIRDIDRDISYANARRDDPELELEHEISLSFIPKTLYVDVRRPVQLPQYTKR
jgi:hypothetical protein